MRVCDAARAAYRLGTVDTLLAAVESGDISLPGIFREQLEGERRWRLRELDSVGVFEDDLADMRIKP